MMNHLNIAFALFVVTNLPFLTLSKVTNDPKVSALDTWACILFSSFQKDPILDFAPPISMDLSLLDGELNWNWSDL